MSGSLEPDQPPQSYPPPPQGYPPPQDYPPPGHPTPRPPATASRSGRGCLAVLAGLVLAVGGMVGGFVIAQQVFGIHLPTGPIPATPATFPDAKAAVIPGITESAMRQRLAKFGWKCSDVELRDHRAVSCLSGRDSATVDFTPTGGVSSLELECQTPVDKPKWCAPLYLSGSDLVFTGDPGSTAKARSWVDAHLKQNGRTTIGHIDIIATIAGTESMTFTATG